MILCAIDDLMFTSKLRVAAKQTGTEIKFVRSPEALLAEARQTQPSLVILDLNADRLRPIDMLEAVKADAALAEVRTIGYASHIDVDRINAARAAGATEVMARSAFVARLPELLRS